MIEEAVPALLKRTEKNAFGEDVLLVAATKTRTPEEINRAIGAGISAIGENKVQEFRDKFDLVRGAERHFIGHLQTNKVKYLIGKCDLIHSADRDEVADEIARLSVRAGRASDVLVQVNVGCEESKGGYPPELAWDAFLRLRGREGLRVRGFMAMLPLSEDIVLLKALATQMRGLFERARDLDGDVRFLSMGMSGDWELCLECGSNMLRLGTAIFGERNKV